MARQDETPVGAQESVLGATGEPEVQLAPQSVRRGRRGRRGLLERAGWNLIDQVLSSASNAALSFLVARSVTPSEFGAFAIGFIVFTVLIGLGRSIAGQPLSIRWSAAEGAQWRDAVSRSMGTILVLTVPVGLLCVLVGLALGDILRPVLITFGLLLPGLILQDACRMAFFAQSRPKLAAFNDALWAVIQFAGIAALLITDHAEAWSLTLVWGASALVCGLVGLVQLGARPDVTRAASWIREHGDLVGYLIAEFLLGAGALQGGILIVGAFIGINDVGSIRAAQVLTGPLAVLFSASLAFGLPEVSRRAVRLTSAVRWRLALGTSVLLTAGSGGYVLILLLIPDSLGEALLGDTWAGASNVLLPVSLVSALAGACVGPLMVILALGQTRATFALTVVEAVTVPIGLFVGAYLGDAEGAAWGLAVQQLVLVPLWFAQLQRILARMPEAETVGTAGSDRSA